MIKCHSNYVISYNSILNYDQAKQICLTSVTISNIIHNINLYSATYYRVKGKSIILKLCTRLCC